MATVSPNTALVFTVRRHEPELVAPAKPTPRESKQLSDIDDQQGLRFQVPFIQFYGNNPSMRGRDPVKVIREAIAQTLVYYYPFAGRIREGPGRKLSVDCTGEGVLFIEADADVTLDQFGDELRPPFPCLEELLYDVPGSAGILNCPLLLFQVTRLKCGGFVLAHRLNHTMTDAVGFNQFIIAMSEMARGAFAPSILPVWNREFFSARDPPRVTCTHHAYDQVIDTKCMLFPFEEMIQQYFSFGPAQVLALRTFIPPHLRRCSTFEVLTACLWRCHVSALQLKPWEEVRMVCVVNARGKFNTPLSIGYYGNGMAITAALTTAGQLCQNTLGYALELVRKAKNDATEEHVKSSADLMVLKGRPHYTLVRAFIVSDMTRFKLGEVDFGWGNAAYGGLAKCELGFIFPYVSFKNNKQETGILVPICLPKAAMERFKHELFMMLEGQLVVSVATPSIKSFL